jgi:hypothetical protein
LRQQEKGRADSPKQGNGTWKTPRMQNAQAIACRSTT